MGVSLLVAICLGRAPDSTRGADTGVSARGVDTGSLAGCPLQRSSLATFPGGLMGPFCGAGLPWVPGPDTCVGATAGTCTV